MNNWLLHGEPVVLISKVATSETSNGFSEYAYTEKVIDNVLIGSPTGSDSTATNIYEQTPEYCLCIPKEDKNDWIGCYVRFWGNIWKVLGVPQMTIDDLTPGPWNKKVMVAKADMEV